MKINSMMLVIFVFSIAEVLTDFVIRSPLSLKKYFDEKYGPEKLGIRYSVANFGDVPYGRSIVG